jgi:hypothetical protein
MGTISLIISAVVLYVPIACPDALAEFLALQSQTKAAADFHTQVDTRLATLRKRTGDSRCHL